MAGQHELTEQRRFSRLSADNIGKIHCIIPIGSDVSITLESTDICPGGFGAVIPLHCQKNIQRGREFAHCTLSLPGLDDVSVKVAELWMMRNKNGESSLRAGFEFTSTIDWSSTGLDTCDIAAS